MTETNAAPPATSFFIPRFEHDHAAAERVYEDLRADAQARCGKVAHQRRIRALLCRRDGTDCSIDVGAVDAIEGQRVLAILQVGRDGFTVHCEDSEDADHRSTVEIARRTVYTVTDFDG